jgi:Tfp pilus assembly protein PilF
LAWAAAGAAALAQRTDPQIVVGLDRHVDACISMTAGGDFSDMAIAECTQGLRATSLSASGRLQVLLLRGITYLRRNENEQALADFDAVLTRSRRQPEAIVNRGLALLGLGRHGEAVAAFTEALGFGVSHPHMAYYNRGAAREALGDMRGAMEDYSTALEIEPDWGPANAEMARFARTRRDQLAEILAERSMP